MQQSRSTHVPSTFLPERDRSVVAARGLSCGDRRRGHRWIVLCSIPSSFDSYLRAGGVGMRGRDGDHRSFGSAGRSGSRCRYAQRVHRLILCSSHTRETFTMKRWDEDKPSGHSFITGSVVLLSRRYRPRKAAPGPYHVVAQLPPRDGQLQYRIKSGCEPFYRTVKENELESDAGATVAAAAS